MKANFLTTLLVLMTVTTANRDVGAQQQTQPQNFNSDKTSWRGFDRFDFLMDDATLKVTPTKASAAEGTGVSHRVDGQLRCVVLVPKKPAQGKPWSWRGRYFDHEPQAEVELLKRGFHIGFVQSDDIRHWNAWYEFLTDRHGLSGKPAFVGMSGGGRNAFTWAATYPDRVSCIYADNPLITRESLMKLDKLVGRDVPLFHICGSLDPLSINHTFPIESIYQQLGGRISVMIKDGVGHHPHSLRDPKLITDFITQSLEPANPPPAFLGQNLTRSSFYGVADRYSEFPTEDMYATCRGPLFSDTFDRYECKPDCLTGTAHVIVPQKAARGMPWVFRAAPPLRDAVVDLALLQRGYHIVTAPRPRGSDRTLMEEWTAFYEHLVEHGFSPKPVMEGAGGEASEIYQWAIANPNKISCIYGENPLLRHYSSEKQPLDHLAPLAKAGVPILHVCGSRDPWLETQTRVAQERYESHGGQVTVIIKDGDGHYPLGPKNPQTVVEFIVDSVASENGTALALFEQRILPIFQALKPSSCTECHLSGVDLKNYIQRDQATTFSSLVSAGLIDLEQPDESKVLQFIRRRPEQPNLIIDKVRQEELAAFQSWIRAAVKDPALLAAKSSVSIGPQVPDAVIRHARKDRVLASFIDNIWTEVGRCAACHAPDQNAKQVEEHGEQVSWIRLDNPQSTLEYMVDAEIINPAEPLESLLLTKPTMQVDHGGGQKMVVGDRTYKQFRRFVDDYTRVVNAEYNTADALPEESDEVSIVTDIWFKLSGVPATYDKMLLQADLYRWTGEDWTDYRVATSDRPVFGGGNLWQHSLSLTAPRGSQSAKDIRSKHLPAGKYLVKLYIDQTGKLEKDFRAELDEGEIVGQLEIESQWPAGYGNMTTVAFPKD